MLIAAVVCFVLHALVAAIDGAYFHLYKYKLHTRPESIVEHFTHTLRAATMVLSAILLFAINAGGLLLWAVFALIGIDLAVETWDVLIERRSRASIGGLSSAEYLTHAHAILLYAASYSLALAAKPPGAFSSEAPLILKGPYPPLVAWVGWIVAVGAALTTIQHIVYLHPKYRKAQRQAT